VVIWLDLGVPQTYHVREHQLQQYQEDASQWRFGQWTEGRSAIDFTYWNKSRIELFGIPLRLYCSKLEYQRIETYRGSRAGHEDQRSKVCSALVGESTSSIDQSTNAIWLNSRSDQGSSPGSGSRGSLLWLNELLLWVGSLGAVVGITKDGAEDSEGGGVIEDRAEGDGGGLNGWEVWGAD